MTERPARGGWIVAATSLGFVVVQLDVTIVNVALPRMGADLGGGVALLQWVVDAYALVFAAVLLSGGTTGDRHGARRPYIAGFAIFGLASLACGLAPSPGKLLAARATQGVGAALLVPTSLALLNHAFEGDSKAPQHLSRQPAGVRGRDRDGAPPARHGRAGLRADRPGRPGARGRRARRAHVPGTRCCSGWATAPPTSRCCRRSW